MIPVGYCQCGCGEKTRLAPRNHKGIGWVKGQPIRFIKGHNGRGAGNGMYNGGHCFDKRTGRWLADRGDGVFIARSRVIMQKHLGRALSSDEIVHHVNHNPLDDCIENLQILSRAEHMLVHFHKERVGESNAALQS